MIKLTIKGKKAHIKNNPITINQTLNFQAINALDNLKIVMIENIKNKYKIISSVPSLDTKTCELQTIRFNHDIAKKFPNFVIITISKDLPFAQTRFCSSLILNENFYVWSDYRNDNNNFSNTTNLLIEETQLLARCVMVLDKNNKILYQQIVKEVSTEPNYQEIINFIENLKQN